MRETTFPHEPVIDGQLDLDDAVRQLFELVSPLGFAADDQDEEAADEDEDDDEDAEDDEDADDEEDDDDSDDEDDEDEDDEDSDDETEK